MNNRERFKILLSVLPSKRENAQSMSKLSSLLKITPREFRQCVLNARKEGIWILSDNKGYWESDSEEELEEFINRRRYVANTIFSYTQTMKNGNPQVQNDSLSDNCSTTCSRRLFEDRGKDTTATPTQSFPSRTMNISRKKRERHNGKK